MQIMKEPVQRLPRPLNTTALGFINSLTPDPKHKRRIEEQCIKEYITNDFQLLGRHMTIEQLSHYLQCTTSLVHKRLVQHSTSITDITDGDGLRDTVRALGSQLISGTLGDRARALQQYSILAVAQGDRYVPFLSENVNRALKNVFDSNAQTLQLLKTLMPSTGTQILIQNGQGNDKSQGVTAADAVQLIRDQGDMALISNPDGIKVLEDKYQYAQLPEVSANLQQGYDSTKEGLNFGKLDNIQLEAMEQEPNPNTHIDRRAEELGIDLGADEI